MREWWNRLKKKIIIKIGKERKRLENEWMKTDKRNAWLKVSTEGLTEWKLKV